MSTNLRTGEKFLLGERLAEIIPRHSRKNLLDEFHIVQEIVKGHKIRESHATRAASTRHGHQIILDVRRQQVTFDVGHNLVEIHGLNVAPALAVKLLERLHGVFLVKVVENLGEFLVGDGAFFVTAKIKVHKIALEIERDVLLQRR